MSWAQENKGLTAFIALTVVSAGGLGYLLFDGWSRDSEQAEKWISVRDSVLSLEGQPLYPNTENVKLKKDDAENFKKVVFTLRTDLARNQPQLKELSDTQFQQKLKQAVDQVSAAAKAKGINVPEAFALGFNTYISGLPKIEASSELDFQLTGMVTLANYLVDSGISAISAVERTSLPIEEGKEAAKPDGKKATSSAPEKILDKSTLKVVFRGKQAAVQQALAHLSNPPKSGSPYLFLRLMRIENVQKKGPSNQESFQPYPVSQANAEGGGTNAPVFPGPPTETTPGTPADAVPAAPSAAPAPSTVPAPAPGSGTPPAASRLRGDGEVKPSDAVNRVFAQIPPAPKAPGTAPAPTAPSSAVTKPAAAPTAGAATSGVSPVAAVPGTAAPASAAAPGAASPAPAPFPAGPTADPALNSTPVAKMAEPMIDTRIILGNEDLVVYFEVDLIRYLPPSGGTDAAPAKKPAP